MACDRGTRVAQQRRGQCLGQQKPKAEAYVVMQEAETGNSRPRLKPAGGPDGRGGVAYRVRLGVGLGKPM